MLPADRGCDGPSASRTGCTATAHGRVVRVKYARLTEPVVWAVVSELRSVGFAMGHAAVQPTNPSPIWHPHDITAQLSCTRSVLACSLGPIIDDPGACCTRRL